MKYRIKPTFFSVVIIIIVGAALVREYDFEHSTFDNLVLSIIYMLTIVFCFITMIKKRNGF